jgi:hypothetical protein
VAYANFFAGVMRVKSFHLDIGEGRQLTRVGCGLLLFTVLVIAVVGFPLMLFVGKLTNVISGSLLVGLGAAVFFGGKALLERFRIPIIMRKAPGPESLDGDAPNGKGDAAT